MLLVEEGVWLITAKQIQKLMVGTLESFTTTLRLSLLIRTIMRGLVHLVQVLRKSSVKMTTYLMNQLGKEFQF